MANKKFTITKQQAAYMLGVDERSLSSWQKRRHDPLPVLIQGKRGVANEYDPAALMQWQIRQALSKVVKTEDGAILVLDEQRARLAKEQADQTALKNAVTRQELAPINILQFALADVGSQIAAICDALPLKIKRRVPKLRASDMTVINHEIGKIRNAAARTLPDFSGIDSAN